MKSKWAISLLCITLMACKEEYHQAHRSKTYTGDFLGRISEVCIDGVIYLVANEKGITPKINADFYPQTCNQNNDIPN